MAAERLAVVGGGIVGLATARALQKRLNRPVVVLEAETKVASHQTGHNSGVIHSGLYYKPGSLKANLCAEGREAMFSFCREHGIEAPRCGKLVVATSGEEVSRLAELEARGRANGLAGVKRIGPEEMRAIEPAVGGIAALHVPETGKTDFIKVSEAMAADIRAGGGEVRTSARFMRAKVESGGVAIETTAGRVDAHLLVNCAGLQCDRVARRCGVSPPIRIVPFRGEYWRLAGPGASLVRHMIYPVPDPRFPFLGVHFLRHLDGEVTVGPNAILGLARHGYRRFSLSLRDAFSIALFPGFWRLALRHPATGVREFLRSLSRRATARAVRRLVPAVRAADLSYHGCGIRAQAVFPDGRLADDFVIEEGERMVHVLNAPSPGATASLAIGRHIAEIAAKRLP
ncbi:MAG: L-2-hydroxyglutarate [Planctomycetota bacterium]|nr:MAG: L-2-hydroxyglutarate [Planctomycetota bacterium]